MTLHTKATGVILGLSIVIELVAPATAGYTGGDMTKKWCTEQVVKKGVSDIARFQAEVRKCKHDPTNYK